MNTYFFTRHIYDIVEIDESNTMYFEINEVEFGDRKCPKSVCIEPDNEKHCGTGFDKWLRFINDADHTKTELITGLRPTKLENVYEGNKAINQGNKKRPNNLILLQVLPDREIMVLDYFNNFYPKSLINREKTIERHIYHISPLLKVF
jgi:hypothetical protein